jgi:hypothetical protein
MFLTVLTSIYLFSQVIPHFQLIVQENMLICQVLVDPYRRIPVFVPKVCLLPIFPNYFFSLQN